MDLFLFIVVDCLTTILDIFSFFRNHIIFNPWIHYYTNYNEHQYQYSCHWNKKCREKIGFNSSATSYTPIGTKYLGPCMLFLLDFLFKNQLMCFICHYSFPVDESTMSTRDVLIYLLHSISKKLKRHLKDEPLLPNSDEQGINILFLLVGAALVIQKTVDLYEKHLKC